MTANHFHIGYENNDSACQLSIRCQNTRCDHGSIKKTETMKVALQAAFMVRQYVTKRCKKYYDKGGQPM
ncbi:hypothetical protein [Desulfosporosinus acidiphilus]|uniref:hypothetical protein n=1 Tax=Desulfosporosinus acidiphilus TaxID=885581 RepID=UPI0011D2C30D|nr:hypothetical protein [Desulfosporosinus acidiphilus]